MLMQLRSGLGFVVAEEEGHRRPVFVAVEGLRVLPAGELVHLDHPATTVAGHVTSPTRYRSPVTSRHGRRDASRRATRPLDRACSRADSIPSPTKWYRIEHKAL